MMRVSLLSQLFIGHEEQRSSPGGSQQFGTYQARVCPDFPNLRLPVSGLVLPMEETDFAPKEGQRILLERLAEFEADPEARLFLISVPRKMGTTTALLEHVARRTQRDVLWAMNERPRGFFTTIAARSGIPSGRVSIHPGQVQFIEPEGPSRYIQTIAANCFNARSISKAIFHGHERGQCTLLEQLIFFTAEGGRPLLLIAEHMNAENVPTYPEFVGDPLFAECFADTRTKTVIICVGPLPERREGASPDVEWHHTFVPPPPRTESIVISWKTE